MANVMNEYNNGVIDNSANEILEARLSVVDKDTRASL